MSHTKRSLDGAKRNPGSQSYSDTDPGLRLRLHPGYKITPFTLHNPRHPEEFTTKDLLKMAQCQIQEILRFALDDVGRATVYSSRLSLASNSINHFFLASPPP